MPKKKIPKINNPTPEELREAEQALQKGANLAGILASGKKSKLKGYEMPKNPVKAPTGNSLPKLEGVSQKDFTSRKAYQNAQARLAGYENYNDWIKARKETGVNQKNNVGRSKITIKDGRVYKFDFATANGNLTETRFNKQAEAIQALLESAPNNMIIQLFIQGNKYGGIDNEKPPKEWGWIQTGLMQVKHFKDLFSSDNYLQSIMQTYAIVDQTNDKGEKVNRGVKEVRILFHDISKKK